MQLFHSTTRFGDIILWRKSRHLGVLSVSKWGSKILLSFWAIYQLFQCMYILVPFMWNSFAHMQVFHLTLTFKVMVLWREHQVLGPLGSYQYFFFSNVVSAVNFSSIQFYTIYSKEQFWSCASFLYDHYFQRYRTLKKQVNISRFYHFPSEVSRFFVVLCCISIVLLNAY